METLRLFQDVAHDQSFSRAAARHGITQSAASQRIGALEKRLGVVLLDRSVRPLTLTEAGRVYLRGCEDVLERHDHIEARLRRMRPAPEGVVRVAAIYSAGIALLEHIKEGFERHYPGVDVELAYNQPDHVYQDVVQQRCDIGIVSYPQRWRKVGILHLRDEPMAVVCAPRHELARRDKVHAKELAAYPMVTFEATLPVGRRIRQYLRDHGVTAPQITNTFDNIDTLKTAVAVTDRVSILPRRTVMREVSAGVLAVVELEPALRRPIGVIFKRRSRQGVSYGPAVEAFVEFLMEHAGPTVDVIDARGERDGAAGELVGAAAGESLGVPGAGTLSGVPGVVEDGGHA